MRRAFAVAFAGRFGFAGFLIGFDDRRTQSPRGARRLHLSAASPTMAGFVQSGGLAAPTLCNEAESSSIALRLVGSPLRASPWGLLLSTPDWLHVGHLFDMLITFQINLEVRLGLAHRNTRKEEGWNGLRRLVVGITKPNRCILCTPWLKIFSAFSVGDRKLVFSSQGGWRFTRCWLRVPAFFRFVLGVILKP